MFSNVYDFEKSLNSAKRKIVDLEISARKKKEITPINRTYGPKWTLLGGADEGTLTIASTGVAGDACADVSRGISLFVSDCNVCFSVEHGRGCTRHWPILIDLIFLDPTISESSTSASFGRA